MAELTGDPSLADAAEGLVDALDTRWDPDRRTWVDDGPTAAGSGRIRTAEALLPVLVERDADIIGAVAGELTDVGALGGDFGPAQVHRDEPRFRPRSYWRGPSWPQLDHLLIVGLAASGTDAGVAAAAELARQHRRRMAVGLGGVLGPRRRRPRRRGAAVMVDAGGAVGRARPGRVKYTKAMKDVRDLLEWRHGWSALRGLLW